MQIEFDLQEPFSYSILPIIVLLVFLIILLIVYFLIKKYVSRKIYKKINVNNFAYKDISGIKNKYVNQLNELEIKFNNKEITNRKAYQDLSMLIRMFVYELTGLEVHKCTLEDISNLNIPVLYDLVKEYYDPEFSKLSRGNMKDSIQKTKEVILRWN